MTAGGSPSNPCCAGSALHDCLEEGGDELGPGVEQLASRNPEPGTLRLGDIHLGQGSVDHAGHIDELIPLLLEVDSFELDDRKLAFPNPNPPPEGTRAR